MKPIFYYDQLLKLIYTLLILLAPMIIQSCVTKSKGVQTTSTNMNDDRSLKFNLISSYCGGANPPEELLQEYQKEKPAKNEELVLILQNQERNKITLKTDDSGMVTSKLALGTYDVFLSEKFKEYDRSKDRFCGEWIKEPNGILTVTENDKVLSTTLKRVCNPCLDFNQ